MRTKVRISYTQSAGGYKHMIIDLLYNPWQTSRSLETYASITFQQGGLSDGSNDWYGMHMSCESDKPEKFLRAYKVLKFIRANSSYRTQPQEILTLIGAEEHVYHNGNYVPLSADGNKYYKVLRPSDAGADSCYTVFDASDDEIAKKIVKKYRWDNPGWTFVPTGKVVSVHSNIGNV